MTDNDKQPQTANNKDTDLTIGERIRKKRKACDLTVDDLAFLTSRFDSKKEQANEKGLSSQTLYRYEKNEREPATREIRLLCKALNVSADWLIFGEVWDSQYEYNNKLAASLKTLIKDANNTGLERSLRDKNRARDERHQSHLLDIKNRKK